MLPLFLMAILKTKITIYLSLLKIDALIKVQDQQKQKSSQPSQHLPSDSDVEEMEPAVAAVSQEITKQLPDLIQNEVNELSENVIQDVKKNDEDDKILNEAVNIISQDVANTMSQVINELQEKEAEETGNVPSPNEIIQKFSRYYVVPDGEKIQKNLTFIFGLLGIIL